LAKSSTGFKPRRITNEDERKSFSSDYVQLDEGESFLGYALFEADPKQDDAGYYEYFEHWDMSAGRGGSSVPCADEDCPLCEDGDRPRSRAKTLWLLTELNGDKLKKPELRIFNFNGKLIKQFTELRAEDEKIMGRLMRVRRADQQGGTYLVLPKTGAMKKGEVKDALKDAPDLEELIAAQGKKAMQRLAVAKALSDDDDDDDVETDDDEPNGRGREGASRQGGDQGQGQDEGRA
jgi:hypothetical protein